jgi:glycosyltransferase involved in cell wall biosynthesis
MINNWPNDTYVLIPSYKSITQLKCFIDELTAIAPKEFICVVDDASRDGTYEYCVDLGIACLRHDVNKGKGAALKTGFAYLTGGDINAKWIITMDADGQHSPADLYRFIKASRSHPSTDL